MATPAGIEVTQLRPQAQARDNYVRPQGYNSGIQQAMNKLADTMHKKQTAEAKARAEELSIGEAINTADDLLNFEAYAQESPAVIAHLKELRGRSWAAKWRTETEDAYNEFKMNSAEDGSDFAGFMQERKQRLSEVLKGDRFLTAGAMSVINETEHNMRNSHRGFLDQRIRVETVNEMGESIHAYMGNMDAGLLTIEQVATQVDDMVQLTHDTGAMHRTEGNKAMFDKVLDFYKATGDERYRLLAENLRYAKGTKGQVGRLEAQTALENAQSQVEERNRVISAREQAKLKEEAAQLKSSSMDDYYDALYEGASGEDLIKLEQAAIAAGNSATTIKSNRDAVLEMMNGDMPVLDHQVTTQSWLLAAIHDSTGSYNGNAVKREDIANALTEGKIHPTHAKELFKALRTAEQVAPLMERPEVKGHMDSYIRQMRDGALFKSEDLSIRIGEYERGFKRAFNSRMQAHFNGNGGQPTSQELTAFAAQAHTEVENDYRKSLEAIEAEDAWYSSINDLATASAEGRNTFQFWDNADEDSVDAFIQSKDERVAKLIGKLRDDPSAVEVYDVPNEDGVLEKREITHAEAFDILSGRKGSFAIWWKHRAAALGVN